MTIYEATCIIWIVTLIFNAYLAHGKNAPSMSMCSIIRDFNLSDPLDCQLGIRDIDFCGSHLFGILCNKANEISSLTLNGLKIEGTNK